MLFLGGGLPDVYQGDFLREKPTGSSLFFAFSARFGACKGRYAVIAVSYTHLDVYKRQVRPRLRARFRFLIGIPPFKFRQGRQYLPKLAAICQLLGRKYNLGKHNAPYMLQNMLKTQKRGGNPRVSPSKNCLGRHLVDRLPKTAKRKPPETLGAQGLPAVDLVDGW